jgi:AraC-like DNA-binding protein
LVNRDAATHSASLGLPRSSGGISRLAYARAVELGIDPKPILERAAISREQIEDPHATIVTRDQIGFLNAIAEAMGDDLLGFHLARTCELRSIGLLYYLAASSDHLVDALQRLARYTSVANEGLSLRCVDGALFGMSIEYVGIRRSADTHQIEFWVAALVRVCRQLAARQLVPARIRFVHRRPAGGEPEEFFGRAVEFGAEADEVLFEKSARDLPIISADPYLNRLLISVCEETVAARRRQQGSFRATVENTVAPLLPHGKAQAGEVARQLGVSQRTLARRLSTEDASFSGVLDDLRADLADRYLADPNLSISQISWLLGYREVASFSHAYKRWTGATPRTVRSGQGSAPIAARRLRAGI